MYFFLSLASTGVSPLFFFFHCGGSFSHSPLSKIVWLFLTFQFFAFASRCPPPLSPPAPPGGTLVGIPREAHFSGGSPLPFWFSPAVPVPIPTPLDLLGDYRSVVIPPSRTGDFLRIPEPPPPFASIRTFWGALIIRAFTKVAGGFFFRFFSCALFTLSFSSLRNSCFFLSHAFLLLGCFFFAGHLSVRAGAALQHVSYFLTTSF